MKKLYLVYLLFSLSTLLLYSNDNDEILKQKIQFEKQEATIQFFFGEISSKCGIVFSYEPKILNTNLEIRLSNINLTLGNVLDEMFNNLDVSYSVHNKVIILKKIKKTKISKKKLSISGIIKDASSSETLVGSTIFSEETKTGEIANTYGFYSIILPEGENKIQFSCLGYENYILDTTLSENIRMDIALKPVSVELNEVIITDKQNKLLDFKQGFTRIEMKSVKNLPAIFGESDVIKAVLLQPGVNNTSELGGNFQVRGGSWDQNLMLLDEAVVYNSNHLFGLYSTYNPDMLKDIKFFKGGIPASYGGRVSSVMDVTQKDGDMKTYHANANIGIIALGATAEGPIIKDKSSFIVSTRRSLFEPYMKYVDNENAKDIRPYFFDINSKLNYIFNQNNRLYLSFYVGSDVMSVSKLQNQTYGNYTGTLRFNHIFSDKLFLNTSLIFSKYSMSVDMSDSLPWKAKLGLEHYEIKNDFIYILPKHRLKFGLQSIFYTFHPGEQVPLTENEYVEKIKIDNQYSTESALFFDDNIKIFERLELQAGLRLSLYNCLGKADVYKYVANEPISNDYISDTVHYSSGKVYQTYNSLEPRVSIKFNITDNQAITTSFNHIKQYVQLVTRTFSPQPYDMWKPSNNYIKPLEANQFALGWIIQLKEKGLDFSVESFYKLLTNVVETKSGAEVIFNKNLDAAIVQGKGKAYGIELAANRRKGKLTGMLSYTWSRSFRTIDSKFIEEKINLGKPYPTDYDIPHKFNASGEYEVSNRFSLTSNFIYQSGRPVSYPSGQFIYMNSLMSYYSGKNQQRYSSFHRLDLGAVLLSKKKINRNWISIWTLTIYNIYNRENQYYSGIRYKSGTRDTEAISMWIFNVVPSLSYKIKF